MTNKNIAKLWFAVIAFAFCWGLVGQPLTSPLFAVVQIVSAILSFWGMARLWKSVPEPKAEG